MFQKHLVRSRLKVCRREVNFENIRFNGAASEGETQSVENCASCFIFRVITFSIAFLFFFSLCSSLFPCCLCLSTILVIDTHVSLEYKGQTGRAYRKLHRRFPNESRVIVELLASVCRSRKHASASYFPRFINSAFSFLFPLFLRPSLFHSFACLIGSVEREVSFARGIFWKRENMKIQRVVFS